MKSLRFLDKLLQATFYFLVFAIPFGTRKLIFQFTEGFNEYNAVFIYGTDIVLLLVLLLSLRGASIRATWQSYVFLLAAGISIFFAYDKGLVVYQFARLLILVGLALATAGLLRSGVVSLRGVFIVLGASAVSQSLVAFVQFARQGSVGLHLLGESLLNTDTAGVAKIAVGGVRYLRAYGTTPHPNVLGGFLVIGLLGLCFLWLRNFDQANYELFTNIRIINFLLILGIFIVTLGLVLTFSRAAWLAAILSVISVTLRGFMNKETRPRALELLLIFIFSAAIVIIPLRALVFPRAEIVAGETSVVARKAYNNLAFQIIKSHPFGVGIGNQVLYSVKTGLYQKLGMKEAWMWQPIHNLYLLIGSEVGVLGLLGFIALVFYLSILNFEFGILNGYSKFNIQISLIMLGALLLLGLFDHYLWTIQQGRLLLWLTIGLAMGLPAGRHGLTNGNTLYYNDKHEDHN